MPADVADPADHAVTDHRGIVVTAAGVSDVGRVRQHNEDAWLIAPPVYVVADGMGGHEAGDRASRAVVRAFSSLEGTDVVTVADMDRCVRLAQALVDGLAVDDRPAPGSTVVAAAFTVMDGADVCLVAHVGDSRAYIWRGGALEQITHDHSLVQEMIDAGDLEASQAQQHPERHVITRAIGALEDSVAEFGMVPAIIGSRILLCSDGLTSEVDDDVICGVLTSVPEPQVAARELVDTAVSHGGRDNVTVVVIDVVGGSAGDDTLPGRTRLVEDPVRTRTA